MAFYDLQSTSLPSATGNAINFVGTITISGTNFITRTTSPDVLTVSESSIYVAKQNVIYNAIVNVNCITTNIVTTSCVTQSATAAQTSFIGMTTNLIANTFNQITSGTTFLKSGTQISMFSDHLSGTGTASTTGFTITKVPCFFEYY